MEKNITAVILAAGKGTRMLPLTQTVPKPLQLVSGKNLIEWKLEALPPEVNEIVLVIGYQGDQIRTYFGDSWKGRPVRYCEQKELNGTGGALWAAKDLLRGRFLVMMGDDLYAKEDIAAMCAYEFAVCVFVAKNREVGGEMLLNDERAFEGETFRAIREEKHYVEEGLVNTGLYVLDERIFQYSPVPIGGSSVEFGLPHTLAVLAKDIPVHVVRTTKWFQITTPEDLSRAEEFVVSQSF